MSRGPSLAVTFHTIRAMSWRSRRAAPDAVLALKSDARSNDWLDFTAVPGTRWL